MSSERFSSAADDERQHRELLAVLDRIAYASEVIATCLQRATASTDPRDVLRAHLAAEKQAAALVASETTQPETTGPQAQKKKDRT